MTCSEYRFEVKGRFFERLSALPPDVQERVKLKLREFRMQVNKYGIDPRSHNNTKYIAVDRVWRLRIGDYRAFFDIEGDLISFLTIFNRKDAYKRS